MSEAGDVAEKAKTLLAAMGSLIRADLMSWAWIFLRSFMEVHLFSSIERYGCSEMNFEMEGDDGASAKKHGGILCYDLLMFHENGNSLKSENIKVVDFVFMFKNKIHTLLYTNAYG